ncbi:MFS transporter, partial [Leucobacter soli]|uniref:MFS transporter n=1 Tax=Leucobacter soli TaxID=2812850 RepID=UPI003621CE08
MSARHPLIWSPPFIAIVLVSINMRLTIASVGPLLEEIATSEGMRLAALGALGAVPMLTWALLSPLMHRLGERFGMHRTVAWSLILLAAGTALRSLAGSPINLWLGTAIIGAALAAGNVLMPAIIKREFDDRAPFVMGAFSSTVAIAGAIASGIVIPLAGIQVAGQELGWRWTLLSFGLAIPVALVAWSWAFRNRDVRPPMRGGADAASATADGPGAEHRPDSGRRVWGEALAWQIAIYMGAQSTIFYTLLTWLVAMEAAQGRSATLAGLDTMVIQIVCVAGSAATPALYRGRLVRWLPAVLPVPLLVACVGIIVAPSLIVLWAAMTGLGLGATFTMSITLIAVRTRTHGDASALSGMAQSAGYTLAAAGPILFGWLLAASGGWTLPMLLLTAIGLFIAFIGFVNAG